MTKIEWTDEVWNPVTGCTKVSQGCKNCYAERIANRFWGERKFTDVICHEDRINIPLHWRKPRRVFVNSMSDLFHEDVPDLFIFRVFDLMIQTKRHTYQILTKRPDRMFDFCNRIGIVTPSELPHIKTDRITFNPNGPEKDKKFLPNVWLGVSCEDQATADKRIPILLQTPAALRFVSYEPALGPIKLQGWDGVLARYYLHHEMVGLSTGSSPEAKAAQAHVLRIQIGFGQSGINAWRREYRSF